MKRMNTILVLLLAIGLVAASALTPAAHAVQTSGDQSGISGAVVSNTTTSTGTSDIQSGGTGEQGDPGGAGDGLGVDPQVRPGSNTQASSAGVVAETIMHLLLLLQVAG